MSTTPSPRQAALRTSSSRPDATTPISTTGAERSSAESSRWSDSVSDDEVNRDIPARPGPGLAVKSLVVIGLFSIFLISIIFAGRSWSKYERDRYELSWTKRSCEITSTAVRESDENPGKYRVEAQVTKIDRSSNPEETLTAYYGKTAEYLFNRETAEEHKDSLAEGNSMCWVKSSDTKRVSVKEVSIEEDELSHTPLYLAWAMTFLGAIAGVLTLAFFSHWLHEHLTERVAARSANVGNVTTPGELAKSRAHLSREQVRHVCTTYAQHVKAEDEAVKDWTCSVCLDEAGEDAVVRTVVLPCQHRFHSECIRKWLRRGNGACPLCNWEARSLFDESGQPVSGKSSLPSPQVGAAVVIPDVDGNTGGMPVVGSPQQVRPGTPGEEQ